MIEARIQGLPDLREALLTIAPKLRKRALRNALAAGARVVRNDARTLAPVLSPAALPVRRGVSASGTLRQAISVRTSKADRRDGNVGVFVNVRPAKAGQRGARNPKDPFYWRFLEFGTRSITRRPFLAPAARKLQEALAVFLRTIGPQIQRLNQPKAPAP